MALEVSVEVVPLRAGAPPVEAPATVQAADGQRVQFTQTIETSRGERSFTVDVTGRHHVRGAVELEYEIQVQESRYEPVSVADYVLHRLDLSGPLGLGPRALTHSRADIVEVQGEPHRDVFQVGDERYEVRIVVRSLRG